MRVQRPAKYADVNGVFSYAAQLDTYATQCEADIAELVEALWNLYENKLEPDKLHIILNRPETRALIAKNKGGQDE